MNIAIIRKECVFTKGGAERYAANLCIALARDGHKVHVLAEKCDPDLHPAITHVPVQASRAMFANRNQSFHRNAQAALTGLRVDAVLALSRSYPSDAFRASDPLHAFWMQVRYPNPVHRFLQSLNPRHQAILKLENAILDPDNTGLIIANSMFSKTIIANASTFPPERIHVIYNGVDHDQFSPDIGGGKSSNAMKANQVVELLFVGQDFKRKGLGPLINALARVKKAGFVCRLNVIGRERPGAWQRLAANLGVADQICFKAPTRAIEAAYRNADFFVFPTLYDPFANVCLEALACGCPVLTTTTNGASEIISEGIDGYVIDGKEAGLSCRIAEKIKTFCQLPANARQEMRSAAVQKAAPFTIQANARAVVDALEKD